MGGLGMSDIRVKPMLNDRLDGLLLLVEGGLVATAIGIVRGLWEGLPLLVRSFGLLVANWRAGFFVHLTIGSILFVIGSSFFLLAYCVDLVVLLWRKDRLFPRLVVRYLAANVLILGLNAAVSWPLSFFIDLDAGGRALEALWGVGVCIVWIPYFRRSPRVKATFVH